eukprot:SAG31_NODE_15853_length_735_cov_0.929245_1_plen_165_part_00
MAGRLLVAHSIAQTGLQLQHARFAPSVCALAAASVPASLGVTAFCDDAGQFVGAARAGHTARVVSAVRSCAVGDAHLLLLAVDRLHRNAMSYASEHGSYTAARAMLRLADDAKLPAEDHAAFIDGADKYGSTPLSYACKQGHEAVVSLLLEDGSSSINNPYAFG